MKHLKNTSAMESRRAKIYKFITITGAFMLLLPVGIPWYWGNLSIYVLSFYYMRCASISGMESSWVISLFLTFRGIFCILCGFFIPIIGHRMTILVGIIVFNLGMLGSYFAVQYSITVFYLMLGIVCGIGAGILYGTVILCVAQWSDDFDVGIITSIAQSAYPFGAIVINELITMYINTNNMKPGYSNKGGRLFSQRIVLKQVPYVFLIFASSFSLIQLIGLALLRDRRYNLKQKSVEEIEESNYTIDGHLTSLTPAITHGNQDYTPKEILRTPMFYTLALTFLLNNYSFLTIVNYYKAFGQLWIRDDHFLTYLGMSMAIFNVLTRISYGILTDKFGSKNTILHASGLICITCSFEYVMPMVSRWLFLITSTLVACLSGAMVCIYTATTILMFGRKNAVTNFGLLNIPSMVMMLIAPTFMEVVVSNGGWDVLFLSGSFAALIAVLMIVKFLHNI